MCIANLKIYRREKEKGLEKVRNFHFSILVDPCKFYSKIILKFTQIFKIQGNI